MADPGEEIESNIREITELGALLMMFLLILNADEVGQTLNLNGQ